MQLNVWTGRSGTGKTSQMIQQMTEAMIDNPLGHPIIFLTPTQNTFQYEQAFVRNPKLKGSIRTSVFGFERLSWRVLSEEGGLIEQQISDEALAMLTYHLLHTHKQELNLYQSTIQHYGFSHKMMNEIKDFKKYNVTPEDIQHYLESNESISKRMKDKLGDIETIYKALEAQLEGRYVQAEDVLYKLIDKIPDSDYIKQADIYIDGFHNFSTLEYKVIETLVKHSRSVTIGLTTDGSKDPFSLFRKTSETLSHIENIAKDLNITINNNHFTNQERFSNQPDLKHLESEFDALLPNQKDNQSLSIVETSNMREEVQFIAREILRRSREENKAFKDFAILYRDPSYEQLIETVLPHFDIAYNHDAKKKMAYHPFIECLRSMLEVIQTGWKFEPVMRMLKTGILTSHIPNASYLIDILENYAFERGISGKRWTNPEFFTVESFEKLGKKAFKKEDNKFLEEDKRTIQRVIQLKDYVVNQVDILNKALSESNTVEAFTVRLYDVIERFELPTHLMTMRDELEIKHKFEEAEQIDQVWQGTIKIFDDLVEVLGDVSLSLNEYIEILDRGLDELNFSMIPQTLDEVTVGNMDLAKVDNKEVVFLLGMNDGVLPSVSNQILLLTDDEKKELVETSGLELSPTSDILQMDEAFVCYIAMTRAKQDVVFTYSLMSDGGEVREMSPFLKTIQSLFTNLEIESLKTSVENDPIQLMEHEHQSQMHIFQHLNDWLNDEIVNDIWLDAFHAVQDIHHLDHTVQFLTSALTYENDTVQLNAEVSEQLYGDKINASVSRFETYNQCPFKHYVSHGLRLNERSKYQIQSVDIGNIFHQTLKYISDEVNGDFSKLTAQSMTKLINEAIDESLPKIQFDVLHRTAHYRYLKLRIQNILKSTLQAMKYQTGNSKFKAHQFELNFGATSKYELKSTPLATKRNIPIQIRGQIDRLDVYKGRKQDYVSIIDYKSSETGLDLTKVMYGMQMQMFTYLDVVLQNKSKLQLKDEVSPGALLYFHVHEPEIKAATWGEIPDAETIFNQTIEKFKMEGYVNNNSEVIDALDSNLTSQLKSNIVPVARKNNGDLTSYSKALDEDLFYKLIQKNRENFVDTASQIMDGHTEVTPMRYQKKLPCQFCEYKSVCHIDPITDTHQYREIDHTLSKNELINILREEEEEE
nr:helicase-exonuclease AddAB subunit AddB [Mammaliicoccus sp. Marseille-Q6498]